jgi:hypothetical protein
MLRRRPGEDGSGDGEVRSATVRRGSATVRARTAPRRACPRPGTARFIPSASEHRASTSEPPSSTGRQPPSSVFPRTEARSQRPCPSNPRFGTSGERSPARTPLTGARPLRPWGRRKRDAASSHRATNPSHTSCSRASRSRDASAGSFARSLRTHKHFSRVRVALSATLRVDGAECASGRSSARRDRVHASRGRAHGALPSHLAPPRTRRVDCDLEPKRTRHRAHRRRLRRDKRALLRGLPYRES